MKASNFFIFGYFGLNSNQLDGQTIKTRSVHKLLEEKLKGKVSFYDTENLEINKTSLVSALIKLARYKEIIYLPAGNNLKRFFPFLFLLSRILSFNIHYFVIGGWLPKLLEKKPKLTKRLRKIKHIYVETNLMKTALEKKFGFNNVTVFPNFRFKENVKPVIRKKEEEGLRIVFLSRINKMKGIEAIFDYARIAPENVTIDFYGPVAKKEEVYFFEQVDSLPNVNYHGQLAPERIQETLPSYDVLVLPTKYYTEGLPGAVVDAYFSGIPVIVTKWIHAHEFVIDGEIGFIIPFENGFETFVERINALNINTAKLQELKENSLEFSRKFEADFAWEIFRKAITK